MFLSAKEEFFMTRAFNNFVRKDTTTVCRTLAGYHQNINNWTSGTATMSKIIELHSSMPLSSLFSVHIRGVVFGERYRLPCFMVDYDSFTLEDLCSFCGKTFKTLSAEINFFQVVTSHLFVSREQIRALYKTTLLIDQRSENQLEIFEGSTVKFDGLNFDDLTKSQAFRQKKIVFVSDDQNKCVSTAIYFREKMLTRVFALSSNAQTNMVF